MKRLLLILIIFFLCSVAVGTGIVLNAFNSGELSPLWEGRSDTSVYYRGCRELENAIALPQGPVIKRPGTYYIADANVTTAVRLISFEYSTDTSYVIELGNTYMRFFKEQ